MSKDKYTTKKELQNFKEEICNLIENNNNDNLDKLKSLEKKIDINDKQNKKFILDISKNLKEISNLLIKKKIMILKPKKKKIKKKFKSLLPTSTIKLNMNNQNKKFDNSEIKNLKI